MVLCVREAEVAWTNVAQIETMFELAIWAVVKWRSCLIVAVNYVRISLESALAQSDRVRAVCFIRLPVVGRLVSKKCKLA